MEIGMPTIMRLPDRELENEEYYEIAHTRVTAILTAITDGRRRMMNDLNLLSEMPDDVMNPPTAWAAQIQTLLEEYVDRVKLQYEDSANDILWYNFGFKLRTNGLRSTILFSFTADLPRS
jgi:hypothetical protein